MTPIFTFFPFYLSDSSDSILLIYCIFCQIICFLHFFLFILRCDSIASFLACSSFSTFPCSNFTHIWANFIYYTGLR